VSTTSDRIYVWVWLPGATDPVPCGVLVAHGSAGLGFRYGDRYLQRPGAVSLAPQLPLGPRLYGPSGDLGMPGPIRDAAPDAWGRRVILHRLSGQRGHDVDTATLPESRYLMESESDRFGAIDFQASATDYIPRGSAATLDLLQQATQMMDAGEILPPTLRDVMLHGTSMGGARPKASIQIDGQDYLAKFSTSDDVLPMVGAEAASIFLAARVGIRVPNFHMIRSLGRDVLLTERFDRTPEGGRRMTVSGLTMLDLDEASFRYGTYPELLEVLRQLGTGGDVGRELFTRIAFNMAISNTDDHLRNHAAFWDGSHLDLTPAFDLSPSPRSGETATVALAYGSDGRRLNSFAGLTEVAAVYGLSRVEALAIVNRVRDALETHWDDAADAARLSSGDKELLWRRVFLNPGTLHDLPTVSAPPAHTEHGSP
jgi:serine/threonine-protein kinase HipA